MQETFLIWLQSHGNPTLDILFKTITALGSDSIYIIVVAWLYWCVDTRQGEKWAYLILSSALLNGIIKLSFSAPRPFETSSAIVPVDTSTATGYSFPSGHSQASAVFGSFLALEFRQRWVKTIGIALFLLIGFSRLYLRVHWPIDVLAGWTLGILVALAFHFYYDKNPLLFKSMAVVLWIVSALYFRDHDQIKLIGLFAAVSVSMAINTRFLHMPVHPFGQGGKRKLVIGMVIVIAVLGGLKAILPESLTLIRYGMVGVTLCLIYPWVFNKVYSPLKKGV